MKISSRFPPIVLALLALCTWHSALSAAQAQGTAFTYQGQLQSSGSPANGAYDFQFALYDAATNGNLVAGFVTNSAVAVSNGLFTTTLDFGPVFTGNAAWLCISVCSNGVGNYVALSPLQPLTPTPYSIYSANAGSAATATTAGTATNATSATTAITATNFSGPLSGDVTGTQSATVVSSVGGVTAGNVASGANAANAASSANTANTIVQRDTSGNFGAGTITANNFSGNGGGVTNLNASMLASGTVADARLGTNLQRWDTIPMVSQQSIPSLQDYFFGNAGNLTMTGAGNTANGWAALAANRTGSYNTASGLFALYNNIGSDNTANGVDALSANTTGGENTATGFFALLGNTTGSYNVADGQSALQNNTTGSGNVADGQNALKNNTTGNGNTAVGQNALQNNTAAGEVAYGWAALQNNTTGVDNTAIGLQTLLSNITGSFNTAIGSGALEDNTTGINNTATGDGALVYNRTGSDNTANGMDALFLNTTGDCNTAVGQNALLNNTIGIANTASGVNALINSDNASWNVAIGYDAGTNIVSGTNDIYILVNPPNGMSDETNIIRIGTSQTTAYIAGIVTATNGFASYATNDLTGFFTTGGYTNLGPNTLRVLFSGTSITLSNSTTTVSHFLGNVSNIFWLLNPNESITGAAGTCSAAIMANQ